MIDIIIRVSCNGCSVVYESNSPFMSRSEAEIEIEKHGWKSVGIYNIWLHFCADCMKPAKSKVASAA